MAKAKKIDTNLELINSIENWIRKYQIANDPYLSRLIQSLRDKSNLSMLATLNPLEYLPNPKIHNMRSKDSLLHFLTVTRNSLVFLPVALTWIAVSKATTAFSLYTSKNSVAVVNFLEFWQNGYGVLAKEWTIGRIAFLDFVLILLVILLTLFTAYLGKRNQNLREDEIELIDSDRTTLALQISAYLFTKQAVTPLSMNQNMATALRQLLNATEALDKSTKVLEKKFKELPTHRDLLLEIKAIKNQIFKRNS